MELNKENFNEIISKGIVFVDFWAVWCGPCQAQGPIIDELEKLYESKTNIIVGKCNIDENQEIAEKHQIMSVPTMILFLDGEEKERINGLQNKENLINLIDKYK